MDSAVETVQHVKMDSGEMTANHATVTVKALNLELRFVIHSMDNATVLKASLDNYAMSVLLDGKPSSLL